MRDETYKIQRSPTDVLVQQHAEVQWQDIHGTESVVTRQDHMEEIVTRFVSYQTSVVKMIHGRTE